MEEFSMDYFRKSRGFIEKCMSTSVCKADELIFKLAAMRAAAPVEGEALRLELQEAHAALSLDRERHVARLGAEALLRGSAEAEAEVLRSQIGAAGKELNRLRAQARLEAELAEQTSQELRSSVAEAALLREPAKVSFERCACA